METKNLGTEPSPFSQGETHEQTETEPKVQLFAYGESKIGRVPEGATKPHNENEDSYFIGAKEGLFIVCDGVGGLSAGGTASREVVKYLAEHLPENPSALSLSELVEKIDDEYKNSHQMLKDLMQTRPELGRMATTASVVQLWNGPNGERKAVLGNIGDSRIYYLSAEGKLEQLTLDDGSGLLTAEIKHGRDRAVIYQDVLNKIDDPATIADPEIQEVYDRRNVITQAVGSQSQIYPHLAVVDLKPGEQLLLMSDGVSDLLSTAQMEYIIAHSPDRGSAVKYLVSEAQRLGSDPNYLRRKAYIDDATAILVGLGSENEKLGEGKQDSSVNFPLEQFIDFKNGKDEEQVAPEQSEVSGMTQELRGFLEKNPEVSKSLMQKVGIFGKKVLGKSWKVFGKDITVGATAGFVTTVAASSLVRAGFQSAADFTLPGAGAAAGFLVSGTSAGVRDFRAQGQQLYSADRYEQRLLKLQAAEDSDDTDPQKLVEEYSAIQHALSNKKTFKGSGEERDRLFMMLRAVDVQSALANVEQKEAGTPVEQLRNFLLAREDADKQELLKDKSLVKILKTLEKEYVGKRDWKRLVKATVRGGAIGAAGGYLAGELVEYFFGHSASVPQSSEVANVSAPIEAPATPPIAGSEIIAPTSVAEVLPTSQVLDGHHTLWDVTKDYLHNNLHVDNPTNEQINEGVILLARENSVQIVGHEPLVGAEFKDIELPDNFIVNHLDKLREVVPNAEIPSPAVVLPVAPAEIIPPAVSVGDFPSFPTNAKILADNSPSLTQKILTVVGAGLAGATFYAGAKYVSHRKEISKQKQELTRETARQKQSAEDEAQAVGRAKLADILLDPRMQDKLSGVTVEIGDKYFMDPTGKRIVINKSLLNSNDLSNLVYSRLAIAERLRKREEKLSKSEGLPALPEVNDFLADAQIRGITNSKAQLAWEKLWMKDVRRNDFDIAMRNGQLSGAERKRIEEVLQTVTDFTNIHQVSSAFVKIINTLRITAFNSKTHSAIKFLEDDIKRLNPQAFIEAQKKFREITGESEQLTKSKSGPSRK